MWGAPRELPELLDVGSGVGLRARVSCWGCWLLSWLDRGHPTSSGEHWEDGGASGAGRSRERLSWVKESGSFCRGVQEPESKLVFFGFSKDQGPGQQGPSPATVPGYELLLDSKDLRGQKVPCVICSLGKGDCLSISPRVINPDLIRYQFKTLAVRRKETAQDLPCSLCAARLWLPGLPKITLFLLHAVAAVKVPCVKRSPSPHCSFA